MAGAKRDDYSTSALQSRAKSKKSWNPLLEAVKLPERLTIDPEILSGKPIIRGSRIAAEFVIGLLAAGMSESDVLDNYPGHSVKTFWLAWPMLVSLHRSGNRFQFRRRL